MNFPTRSSGYTIVVIPPIYAYACLCANNNLHCILPLRTIIANGLISMESKHYFEPFYHGNGFIRNYYDYCFELFKSIRIRFRSLNRYIVPLFVIIFIYCTILVCK